ncbi:type-2 ice-structuring protein-like [Cottoperca gobio]|uniref:Type-2 ice-structuring protein-like n=1 Tax=Cottoperca gobio TaxID=56716 RepID=A0A6J2RPR3_COTGO|nr:type-2 ice-structuring protein-like [Cottoperca gobio]
MCAQTGGNLLSLHTPEERQFVRLLANTHTPVWLGGLQAQQNGSWFWSDDTFFTFSCWTNQRHRQTREGGACMAITPTSGELHSAPCGELKFYICSTAASSTVSSSSRKPVEPAL